MNAKSQARAFLAAYRVTASITKAAKAAKIERQMHYRWLAHSPGYAAAFEQAKDRAAQSLEDEAVRRAHQGVLEPKFWQGEMCGHVRVYSDTLLMFLLKGMRPDKYRETWKGEISGPGGGPISLEGEKLSRLSDEELAAVIAIARKLEGDAIKS